jgi:hypothetical protein
MRLALHSVPLPEPQIATTMLRRSFITFHLTLGLTLLVLSIRTALHALGPGAGQGDSHVVVLAILEAIGAVLFLLRWTLRGGGMLLLLTIGLALLVHLASGQFRGDLLVYAAGTWFVMVHGPGRTNSRWLRDVAAQ